MSKCKRKVSFYRLIMEQRINGTVHTLSNTDCENYFNRIVNDEMLSLANGNKAIIITTGSGEYVLEVIHRDNHVVFAKIGQQNNADTVALRDHATLETENVPMSASQALELYTYLLIDFETCILSYISISGAPRISAIRGMFNTQFEAEGIESRLAAILTNDVIATLSRKHVISTIEVTVAVPSDQVLSNAMGMSLDDFDSLRNVKARTATYRLIAPRNRNIFASSSRIGELIDSIRAKFGGDVLKMSVRAKDEGESTQTYDLIQYCFTKTVPLGREGMPSLEESDFRTALENTYSTYRAELMHYIRMGG